MRSQTAHVVPASPWAKADRPTARSRWGHEPSDRVKDDFELSVVFLLERVQLAGERLVRGQQPTESHEGPHDRNVGLDGARTPEDAREHSDAMFSEYVWRIAPAAASHV